jgi:hypothetical protein
VETQIQSMAGEVLASVEHSEGPNVVNVQRIGWKKLAEAAKVRQAERFTAIRDMGGVQFVQGLMEIRGSATAVAEPPVQANPVDDYDTAILLAGGVQKIDGKPSQANSFDNWTPELAEAAAREVLRLSRPMLFDTEEQRKNA